MQAPHEAPGRSTQDVRDLLRYVLQAFEESGGKLEKPVGCTATEDWLLDAVNVRELLKVLGSGSSLNIVQVCTGSSLPPAATQARERIVSAAQADDAVAVEVSESALDLPVPTSGLEDWQLQELAFTIYIGCCGQAGSFELIQYVRLQLEVSEARAKQIQQVIALAAANEVIGGRNDYLGTLELHVRLLLLLRPLNFPTFAAFVRWQGSTTAMLLKILTLAAHETHAAGRQRPKGAAAALELPKPVSGHLARLAGSLRRLRISEEGEYDEDEYAEAAAAARLAAIKVAGQTRTGWRMPWALRMRIAELLLRCIFESPESSERTEESDALVEVLTHRLWPVLDIMPAVHTSLQAWILFRQATLCNDPSLLEGAKSLFTTALAARHDSSHSLMDNGFEDADEEAGRNFAEDIGEAISDWVCAKLSDYVHEVPEGGDALADLVEVLAVLHECMGQADALPDVLASCVQCAVAAELQRRLLSIEHQELPHAAVRILLLAEECQRFMQAQDQDFLPVLVEHLPNVGQVAALRVHQVYGAQLLPWLRTVHKLDEQTALALQAASGLEEELEAQIPPHVQAGWCVRERIEPLLQGWVAHQLDLLRSWSSRILAGEDWRPVTLPRGCSRSAIDTVKIVTETLEGLFDLQVALTEDTVRACSSGVADTLAGYADYLLRGVGSIEALVPPLPPLTRYKQDLVAKAQAADTHSRAKQPGSPLPPRRDGNEDSARQVAEYERVKALTVDTLMVRLNSLHYLRSNALGLSSIAQTRWDGAQSGEQAPRVSAAKQHLGALFDGTLRRLDLAAQTLIDFACTKVVFWDMRTAVLEDLYRHSVASARVHPVVEGLDGWLGQLCSAAVPDLHPLLARALLLAAVNALLRVLLHGGPFRWFIPEEVPLIEADVEQLGALFHAEGEGLPDQVITSVVAPVEELLTVLQLDTSILIANFKQARMSDKEGYGGIRPPSAAPAFDMTVLQQVLGHRADRAASKVLKTELATPKKVGVTGLQWPASLTNRRKK